MEDKYTAWLEYMIERDAALIGVLLLAGSLALAWLLLDVRWIDRRAAGWIRSLYLIGLPVLALATLWLSQQVITGGW